MSAQVRRGQVWRVQLDPAQGAEQAKSRPVVVLSEPTTGRPTVFLCAPIVHRKPEHRLFFWCVELSPGAANGLRKDSTADAAQTRALDTVRFLDRLGEVSPEDLEAVTTAVCLCVGRQPIPQTPPT